MGGVGDADKDQVFYDQSFCAVEFEVFEKDALGQDEGGGFL